jgi:hypothetical protein
VAALTFTCGDNVIINGEIHPIEPTSPANVLKIVEISFNQRDIDLLKRALSTNFVYYTDPGELGRPRPEGTPSRPPPIYSFTEFWHIAYNMFNGAYSITLSIPTGRVGEPGPEENTFRAGDVELSLLVAVDELSGYVADKGYCHFEFEKYKNEQGRDRWRLTKWWDDTEGGADEPPGFERVPLWYILSLYE